MIKRILTAALQSHILRQDSARSVIIVDGARQVGKTTIVEQVLQSITGIPIIRTNLEEDKLLTSKMRETDSFESFLRLLRDDLGLDQSTRQVLFIDEAQESEVLGAYVRFLKEKLPLTSTILSGSSMTRLFRPDQRVPVGRYTKFTAYPLSFSEFLSTRNLPGSYELFCSVLEGKSDPSDIDGLTHNQLLKEFDNYIEVGGLPRAVITFNDGGSYVDERRTILASQEDDFIRKSGVSNARLFMAGLRGIANNIGFPSKYTHIGQSHAESKQIMSLLDVWHLAIEVEQRGSAATSAYFPKRYLYDVGIAQTVRNMPFPKLSLIRTTNAALRTQLGGVFENATLINILASKHGNTEISGWKSAPQDPVEVDFVWREGRKVIPIECKASLKIAKRNFSSLLRFLNETDLDTGILLSAAPFGITKLNKRRLINVPIYLGTAEVLSRMA